MDIIIYSVQLFALSSVGLIAVSYIIFKIKDRNRIKPYQKYSKESLLPSQEIPNTKTFEIKEEFIEIIPSNGKKKEIIKVHKPNNPVENKNKKEFYDKKKQLEIESREKILKKALLKKKIEQEKKEGQNKSARFQVLNVEQNAFYRKQSKHNKEEKVYIKENSYNSRNSNTKKEQSPGSNKKKFDIYNYYATGKMKVSYKLKLAPTTRVA